MDNRVAVEKIAEAIRVRDLDFVDLIHPDIVVRYPQSGEVIRGRDNYIAMLENFPSGLPDEEITDVHGGKESVEVTRPAPFAMPMITVVGSGNTFILEGIADYADSGRFHSVIILTMKDGQAIEEVDYYAAPFDPPDWRRPYRD